jgi:hypothetical protein
MCSFLKLTSYFTAYEGLFSYQSRTARTLTSDNPLKASDLTWHGLWLQRCCDFTAPAWPDLLLAVCT